MVVWADSGFRILSLDVYWLGFLALRCCMFGFGLRFVWILDVVVSGFRFGVKRRRVWVCLLALSGGFCFAFAWLVLVLGGFGFWMVVLVVLVFPISCGLLWYDLLVLFYVVRCGVFIMLFMPYLGFWLCLCDWWVGHLLRVWVLCGGVWRFAWWVVWFLL